MTSQKQLLLLILSSLGHIAERQFPGKRENWSEVGERNLSGLKELGKLSDQELMLMREMQSNQKAQPSGRWLWIGGTPWINKNQNFSGAYNCTCLLYTSPSPRDRQKSRMPSSA